MQIAIRADASVHIGTGHVMRCHALADTLRAQGAQVVFICRDLAGHLGAFVRKSHFDVMMLPPLDSRDQLQDAVQTVSALGHTGLQADWLLVDHYGLDIKWERHVRSVAKRIAVIDDLADRTHECDLLVDQNLCHDMKNRYAGLVPEYARLLLGPKYALLREEFLRTRAGLPQRAGQLRRILLFFGGSDEVNETAKALEGLQQFDQKHIAVDVIVGSTNPHRAEIERICSAMPQARFHCQVSNMAELMRNADLAIGAGGTTTWERCCLGLPSLVAMVADNQRELTEAVSEYGAVMNLGQVENLMPTNYRQALAGLTQQKLSLMEERGMQLVDGKGCARVVEALAVT